MGFSSLPQKQLQSNIPLKFLDFLERMVFLLLNKKLIV